MYDCEEIEASANGLGRIERELPDWLHADVAILGEPSGGSSRPAVRARCASWSAPTAPARTRRDRGWATTRFTSSARCWTGCRRIRPAASTSTAAPTAKGLSAVRIDGGVAGNVIPDAASVTVNFRFAPDRSVERGAGSTCARCSTASTWQIELTDAAAGALPGLTKPAAAALVEAAGGQVRAKYGWTDVARFAALGIPAVNYGPGDPNLAHRVDERVEVAQITAVTDMLRRYLTA